MIYLFGTGEQVSIVYQGNTLTEENKAKATLVVEELPDEEEREGYYAVLYIDPESKELSYIYKEKSLTQEEKIQAFVDDGILTQEQADNLLNLD